MAMRALLLIAVTALAGCVAQPPAAEPPAAAASAPASAVEPAAATASTQAGQEAVAQNDSAAFEPPPGFRERVQDGQTVYCRKVVVLGSRFPKQICMSQAQLEDMERGNQAMRDNMSQSIGVCGSSVGCGGN